ncbi:ABC transporter permease [Streptomyces sp. NPDC050560]|uniref:ABC transporter permease n=1 Tax=Streptomyces sp. NPDC050560 TaxID=3365630 RepID=UPI003789EA28
MARAQAAPSGAGAGQAVLGRLAALARPRNLLNLALLLVLGYLVLPPLVVMVWKSFVDGTSLDGAFGLAGYRSIAGAGLGSATADTLVFAAGTTVVSLVVGTALAWSAARTDAPLRGLAYVVGFLGLAVPGIVNVVGWVLLFGNGHGQGDTVLSDWLGVHVGISVESMPGMVFVESLLTIPLVFFLMIGPMQAFDSSLEEAGAVHGARDLAVLRRITAPLLLPTLASATLLVVIRSIQAFEVPVLLGVPAKADIFTARLYETLHGSLLPDYSGAASYGTILVVALLVLVSLENRLTRDARKYAVVTGRATAPRPHRTRPAVRYLPLLLNAVLLVCYLLPTCYLLYSSFERNLTGPLSLHNLTLDNYSSLWSSNGFTRAVADTLVVAAGTSVVTVVLTLLAGWVAARSGSRPARLVNLLANAPLVVPGVVFGFAILLFYLFSPIPLFGTLWAIVLAFVALYLPYGMRTMRPAIVGISTELEEAGRIAGASETGVVRRILLPLVAPSALGTGLFVFFNAFRELAVAALVITAATPLLSTKLLDALVNGDLTVVSALGTFIMAVSLVVGALAFRLVGFRRGASQLTKEVGQP